jgi:hypothetical protein
MAVSILQTCIACDEGERTCDRGRDDIVGNHVDDHDAVLLAILLERCRR